MFNKEIACLVRYLYNIAMSIIIEKKFYPKHFSL